MLLRCWCESSQRNNKVLNLLRIQIQNTNRKTKNNVKTPDSIFLLCILRLPNRFSPIINIILGVMSCHDHLRRISSYILIFLEYPQLTYRDALHFFFHAYRFYAHNIANMIMA